MVANKYIRRANIQYFIILLIVTGIAVWMNISNSDKPGRFDEPEVVEEIIESIPSEMP